MLPKRLAVFLLATVLLATVLGPGMVKAQAPGITMTAPFTDIVEEPESDINTKIKLTNVGTTEAYLQLSVVTEHNDWNARLQNIDWDYDISSLRLPPGTTEAVQIYLRMTVPTGATPQKAYKFTIKATQDGATVATLPFNVTVGKKVEFPTPTPVVGAQKIKLTADFPFLRGPSGKTFVFRGNVSNVSGEDQSATLSLAPLPAGWQVRFKVAFEDKLISTISMPLGSFEKGIDIEVDVPQNAEANEYAFQWIATGKDSREALPMGIVVVGTYSLAMDLPSGRLNMDATAGQDNHTALTLINIGTADLQNLSLTSSAPSNWVVTFTPDRVDFLAAGQTKDIDVSVKPPSQSIAGDYGISVTTSSPQAVDSLDIRVAVGRSTVWGWVGIGIVGLVILGMAGVFVAVGRR